MVMDDESYFMVDGNEWHQQSFIKSISEDHPATEDVKFIRNTQVSSEGFGVAGCQGKRHKQSQYILKPVLQSTKKCSYPNVKQYLINVSKNYTKIVFWPDLASCLHTTQRIIWSD
jgi:hypothetical protein